jgi:EmrB/QacA subfamily drug resistance transporter
VASLMVALDALVVSTALNTIRLDLGASIEELEWTVNAYSLSFAVLLMTAAALGDRFGRRRIFAAGLGLFVTASIGCALAQNVGWLIAARSVQGIGAAMVMPLALALISAAFPPELRGKALGIFSGVTGLAVVAGPVVGGAVAEGIAWEWIFWLNVPIGLLAIPFVLSRIKESYGSNTTFDIGGLVLVTGAAFGIVWGLVRSNSAGWGSLEVVAALGAGVLLGIGFVVWEGRARSPMVPLRFFRSRAFASGNAANFFLYASLLSAVFFMAQFLQAGLGYGPLGAGLRLIPWTATLFIVAPLAGSLVNRLGERILMVGGLFLQALGLAWLGLIVNQGLDYSAMVLPLVVAGCGVSMAMPATQNSVLGAVARNEVGKASGIFSMMRQLGGVFGIAILAAVFTQTGSFRSAQAFSSGFAPAISVSAGLSLLGAIAGLWLPGRRPIALVEATQQVSSSDRV